jgi:hypothetical protein
MQVYGKGEWKKLPRLRQRLMARYLLTMPFIQAATGLLIPVSIILILTTKVPTAIALVSFVPLAPTLVLLAVEFTGLREFGRVYGQKVRARDYFRLVWGLLPYQIFLALAAVRAVFRQLRGLNAWEKTEHTGAHRDEVATEPQEAPRASQQEPAMAMTGGDR